MDGRLEVERGQGGVEDVDETERWMVRHQMAAALGAVFAFAERGLGEGRDVIRARRDLYRLGLPQAEGVHRSARPRATGPAVAIAHRFGRAADLQGNRAAKTASTMSHGRPSSPVGRGVWSTVASTVQPRSVSWVTTRVSQVTI